MKSLANRRTGNQSPTHNNTIGDLFQKLTCEWRSTVSIIPVEDLNEKLDNYLSPIDHTPDSELGIIQTKGKLFDSYNRYWGFGDFEGERLKEFDCSICYCTDKSGRYIERIYIFPKEIIVEISSVIIYKNPTNSQGKIKIPWYEKYRVTDKDELRKVDKIWKEIIKKKNKVLPRN